MRVTKGLHFLLVDYFRVRRCVVFKLVPDTNIKFAIQKSWNDAAILVNQKKLCVCGSSGGIIVGENDLQAEKNDGYVSNGFNFLAA